jgi:hypothetical protein
MKNQSKSVIVQIKTVDEKYCDPNCPYRRYDPIISVFFCRLLGFEKTLELKFDKKVNLSKRSRICTLKEVRIKNAM